MSKTINQDNLNATLRMLDKMGEANLEKLRDADPALAEQLEKLGALLGDEDFGKEFLACADHQAAVRLFADHGFVLTEDEVAALVAQLKSIARKVMHNDGTLSEEELEQISGGASLWGWLAGIGGGIAGGAAGAALGAFIGAILIPGPGAIIGVICSSVIGGLAGGAGGGIGAGMLVD